jgi:hypothetical protein
MHAGQPDRATCSPAGSRLHDKPLPDDEVALAEISNRLSADGHVFVVVA